MPKLDKGEEEEMFFGILLENRFILNIKKLIFL